MTAPEKAELKSMDVAEDKRRQLAQMFPEIVTETRTEDGRLVRAVDFEKLKAVLGQFSDILENQKERYGMTWPGKNECLKIIQQPSIATLKPCREESVNFDQTENLFIEGDNLEVLKLLQKAYYGKVKMIYIDPPYNTGKDFIYPDNYAETLETYLAYTGQVDADGRKFSSHTEAEGRYHSKWMSMMFPRLYLAKNLLRDDGVIFISIDDNEVANLRALCNDVFGEENFIAQVVWEKMYTTKNDASSISQCHEYLLVYGRSADECGVQLLPRTAEMDARYSNPDNDPRDVWKPIPLYGKGERKNGRYAVVSPKTGKKHLPEPDHHWLYVEEDTKKLIADNRIYFGKDGNAQPNIKRFLSEVQQGTKAKTLWKHSEVGSNDSAKRELRILYGENQIPFDFPKPITLIERAITLATKPGDGDIVLDFFAGSGTTAHAVYDKNRQDKGNRRFILVQLPEPSDIQGFKTISGIAKDRMRRAITKLDAADGGHLDLDQSKTQDRGFRAFTLALSNFKVWDSEQAAKAPEAIAKQLELHEQHIAPNATQEDILYELLLKAGFPLTTKVEKVQLAGKAVFSIADGTLLVCLERAITKELIKAMADADPLQVICLDEGFKANDQLKANAVQTFKARSQGKGKESGIVFRTV